MKNERETLLKVIFTNVGKPGSSYDDDIYSVQNEAIVPLNETINALNKDNKGKDLRVHAYHNKTWNLSGYKNYDPNAKHETNGGMTAWTYEGEVYEFSTPKTERYFKYVLQKKEFPFVEGADPNLRQAEVELYNAPVREREGAWVKNGRITKAEAKEALKSTFGESARYDRSKKAWVVDLKHYAERKLEMAA